MTTLDDDAYASLRRAAETYRESLCVRLCGEVGLRPAEIAVLTPSDVTTRTTRNGDHHVLTLAADGPTGRTGYVPPAVQADLDRYVNEAAVGPDERVFDVTPRRIQMLLSTVADRAATASGDPRLRDVSSRDLRRYYAHRLLFSERVDPRVVLALGGWNCLDTLVDHPGRLEARSVIEALDGTSLVGGRDSQRGIGLERAIDQTASGVLVTDSGGVIEYANDGYASLTGFQAAMVTGRDRSFVYATDDDHARQNAGEAAQGWVRLRRRDRAPASVFELTTPLVSERGDTDGSVTVFVDVTDDRGGNGRAERDRVKAAITGLRAVGEALQTTSNRSQAEAKLCERLTTTDAYGFAWVGARTGDGRVASKDWAGITDADAAALAERYAKDDESPCDRAIATGEVQVLGDAARDWLPGEFRRAAVVPLTYGDRVHGVLVLGTTATNGFEREERDVLDGIGWQVGQAMTDMKRKKLLLADTVVELEFHTRDTDAFFVDANERFGASFRLQGIVPGEQQSLLYFVLMSGGTADASASEASPDEVLTFASESGGIEDARLIRDYGDDYLIEFVVTGEEPAMTLTEFGGHVTRFVTEDGVQRLYADFTPETDIRAVLNGLRSSFPDAELVSKQEVQQPLQTSNDFRRSLKDDLTAKQQSVLRATYLAGYFEWPRGSTAEELADSIGVSAPTLHNHLRKAQQKLLTAFFDETTE